MKFIAAFMIYLYIKPNVDSYNDSLLIVITTKSEEGFYADPILFTYSLQKHAPANVARF
jgi:hypothetical protein